jgi:hypothetical protein
MNRRNLIHPIFLFFALAALLLASCGPTKVQTTEEYAGKLPRPDRILVYDFAVSPDEVKHDTGLSTILDSAQRLSAQWRVRPGLQGSSR